MKPVLPVGVTAVLLALSACGPGGFESLEQTSDSSARQGVIGGVRDEGDPAVVALASGSPLDLTMFCSGTLIDPVTVLTAAHCLGSRGATFVAFGTDVASPDLIVPIVRELAHPSWGTGTLNADLGLVQLATPVTTVAPIPLNSTRLDSSFVGVDVRHVGFGRTKAGDSTSVGEKREATYPLLQFTSDIMKSGAPGTQVCRGDSGGPAFIVLPGETSEVLAGAVSFGDVACASGAWDTRIDYHLDWILAGMASWVDVPSCLPDSKCVKGCDPVDPDCENLVPECADGAVEACFLGPSKTEGVGQCRGGGRVCVNGFWSTCVGQQLPSPERCDGLDNDCDGASDEDNPGGGDACTIPGEQGECASGVLQCVAGGMVCVSTATPTPEICDGKDNDCDGFVDDGFPALSCGVGECFRLVPACANGELQTCVPGTPSPEIADFKDNDCNGLIDDGIDCRSSEGTTGHARLCYAFPTHHPDGGTALIGACQRGVQTCQADAGWGECVGEIGPSPELCDGIDNDCDGHVDEGTELGWERCGLGICKALVPSCRLGMANVCTPGTAQPEACNGVDDSCDGRIDEGCACRDADAWECYSGPAENLDVGACRAGTFTCRNGAWSSCEGEMLPSTEYCDGVDNDCNGLTDDACTPLPGGDAGHSTEEDPEAQGCSCSSTSPQLAPLLLLACGLVRRRAPPSACAAPRTR